MFSAINWHDQYTLTKERIIYTQEQHHVPGVHALARHTMKDSIPSLKWHYHENSFEFTISTKGTFSFSTRTSSYRFSGGGVFIAFPDEIHGTNDIPVSVGEIYWFQLDISNPKEFLFMNENTARHMIESLRALPHHVVQADAEEMRPLIQQAFYLAQRNDEPEFIASYLQLFLHLLIHSANNEKFALSPDIGRTLNYILDNITEELPLEELAVSPAFPALSINKNLKNSLESLPDILSTSRKLNMPSFFSLKACL